MHAPNLLILYKSRKLQRDRSIKINLSSLITRDYSMHDLFERAKIIFSISLIYGKQMRWIVDESKRIVEMFEVSGVKRVRRTTGTVRADQPLSNAADHEDAFGGSVHHHDAGSIIDHDVTYDVDHNDFTFPSEVEVGRAEHTEMEIKDYELKQPRYRRTQGCHALALKDAFIIQSITAKLRALEAHLPSEIELARNDVLPEYDYDGVNVSDFVEDNSVVEYEKDEFVFGEVVQGKPREEQADIFYGLLVNIEKGNVSVEQHECYGEIRCKKMAVIV
ncbi:putative Rad21/Rec8-like protein,  Rad21/Rec8-like protein,  eukaryotic protein [Trachipleistophora hominis]|uniref:Putative Rad21/Rec8-like protein, Rad21/Rec8-like protein, eukaryotic protein n=1 Tax=Trachipleistophora hominis TaxID=72359 RepID=L7JUF5_TRAHO|nr:putative Rad21/Rec8-like protein,  Rad21/Rec8-like protein,  eukaryotic protein [Trachipleistophora hominis]